VLAAHGFDLSAFAVSGAQTPAESGAAGRDGRPGQQRDETAAGFSFSGSTSGGASDGSTSGRRGAGERPSSPQPWLRNPGPHPMTERTDSPSTSPGVWL
jgi:hypothetical protein